MSQNIASFLFSNKKIHYIIALLHLHNLVQKFSNSPQVITFRYSFTSTILLAPLGYFNIKSFMILATLMCNPPSPPHLSNTDALKKQLALWISPCPPACNKVQNVLLDNLHCRVMSPCSVECQLVHNGKICRGHSYTMMVVPSYFVHSHQPLWAYTTRLLRVHVQSSKFCIHITLSLLLSTNASSNGYNHGATSV